MQANKLVHKKIYWEPLAMERATREGALWNRITEESGIRFVSAWVSEWVRVRVRVRI